MAAQTLPGTLTAFSDAHSQTHPHSDTHMPAFAVRLTLTHILADRQAGRQ